MLLVGALLVITTEVAEFVVGVGLQRRRHLGSRAQRAGALAAPRSRAASQAGPGRRGDQPAAAGVLGLGSADQGCHAYDEHEKRCSHLKASTSSDKINGTFDSMRKRCAPGASSVVLGPGVSNCPPTGFP